jgi:putative flippase GtrA
MAGSADEPRTQFARFCVVGAGNTLVTLLATAAGLALGLHYLTAGALAFALGAVNGYVLNRSWTFRAGGPRARGLARYVTVQGLCLGLDVALLRLLHGTLGLPELVAQATALPPVTITAFTINRRWTFQAAAARRRMSEASPGLP